MGRSTSVLFVAAVAALISASSLAAQDTTKVHQDPMTRGEDPLRAKGAVTVGPVAAIDFPMGDTGDAFGNGFTIGGQVTYGMGAWTALGEVTYNTLSGGSFEGVEIDDASGVAFDVGGRYGFKNFGHKLGFYAGGLVGLWTGDFDSDFDVVPFAGIKLGPVDVEARYKGLFGDADWFSVGGLLHFRIK